ncbi:MAG: Hsp33 family molecular chaperone HslO [Myxococcota bacterium]
MERQPDGRFVAALACEGRVRVMAVVAVGPAEELRLRHGLSGHAATVAAEGLIASLLLSAHVKGEERLTINVRAERPDFSFLADVNGDGTLRARFTPDRLGPLVGAHTPTFSGILSVLKSLGPRELYKGVAEVKRERFEGALQRYLTSSQQVDGRVRIQAALDADGKIAFAAGLLVERLPDFPAEEFAAVFDAPLKGDFKALMTQFAFGQLAGGAIEVLGARDVRYQCTCSRDRVVGMLKALGHEEIASLLAEQGQAEVSCHYCNTRYVIDAEGLGDLLLELNGPPS